MANVREGLLINTNRYFKYLNNNYEKEYFDRGIDLYS